MTIQSFEKVLNDPRIDDIVILDDCSFRKTIDCFYEWVLYNGDNKVRFIEQSVNVGMSRNKRDAIANAKNEWCIILDSDNIIGPDYLDAFYRYITRPDGVNMLGHGKEDQKSIFCPDFAKPDFDYTMYSGEWGDRYDITNIKDFIKDGQFNCLMNTCNYVVNRDFYLKTYQHNEEHIASDTIWHNYNHLKAGGNFHVVPGMQYFHRVHEGSGFREKIEYNMIKSAEVKKLIQQL